MNFTKEIKFAAMSVAMLCAGFSMGAPSPEAVAAAKEICDGTKGMVCDGVPGTTLALTKNAFGLLRAKNWDGTVTFACVGSIFGEGRAIYFGHPGFMERGKTDDDSARFMRNAVRWLAKGKENPKIGVVRNQNVARTMREVYGIEVSVVESLDFGGFDVIIANSFEPSVASTYVDYVRNGGSLMGSGLGWAWKQYNPDGAFSSDFADNLIFAPMGILMGDNGCTHTGDNYYSSDPAAVPHGTRVDDALDVAATDAYADKTQRKQVSTILAQAAAALPPTLPQELTARFDAFASNPKANKVPSVQSPVEAEDIFARLSILARKARYEADVMKAWPADPSAASYPRLVKPGTEKIERTVEVDCSIPRWHSTGVFAAAGEPVTVEIPADAVGMGLRLRIGTTADDLSTLSEGWKRFPKVTVEVPLTNAVTAVTSPFGGLVYVVVPEKASGVKSATIKGGVMAPWFKLGRDTSAKFAEECRKSGAPQAEIEGDSFIVTADIEGAAMCEDPEWIAKYWDKVLGNDWWLSGRNWKRPYPERFCSDVQLIAGWLHNGYPMMCHTDYATHFDISVDKEKLAAAGGWGIYHEIGHNHQNADWTPDGTGEVTCNIFTLLAIKRASGRDYRDNGFETARRASAVRVLRWVGMGKPFKKFKEDYFLALEFYARLIDAFDFEAFQKTFARYYEPDFTHPKDDDDKWNVFAREFSKAANANVAEVMALWSMPITEETLAACARYPKAPESLVADMTLEPYVGPRTEPVEGEYMGVCLAGDEIGKIELYPTRKDVPGGEKNERWKGDWMLLRRVEAQKLNLGDDGRGREVEFTRPFYIGVYEVTRQQWFNVAGEWKGSVGSGAGKHGFKPANDVSNIAARGGIEDGVRWPETGHKVSGRSFLGKLRELTGMRAEFDLPTEAQWETACRAGSTVTWNNGCTNEPYKAKRPWAGDREVECDHVLDRLGRYFGNGSEVDGPAVVGSYEPNAWGLYDMHGNVWEQCLDYMTWNLGVPSCSGTDPVGHLEPTQGDGDKRVIMGGSFWNDHYGRPGQCHPDSKALSVFFSPGSSSGAIGMRVCVDGAIAKESSAAPWGEKLGAKASEARGELVRGIGALHPVSLPGQVFVIGSDAFPVLAARTWDNRPACWGAGAFCGKGRVFHISIDPCKGDDEGVVKLLTNARSWLKHGMFGKVREIDGSSVSADDIPGLVDYVRKGGGLLVTGRAWPWWQSELESKGSACAKDWPGNLLMKEFGIMSGRFIVRSDSGDGYYSARIGCLAGAAEPQSDAFETQKFSVTGEPVAIPKLVSDNGTLVPNGAKIAFLGDSITRLGNDKGSWIDQVMEGLANAGAKDLEKLPAGWDGQNAGDMAGRAGGLVNDPDVKVMTLSCGVNDIWGFDWNRGVELHEYKRNVRAIYDKAARNGVLVVAMTPTLIRENPDNDYNKLLEPFAEFIREEAARRGLPLADCRKAELEFLKGFKPDTGRHFSMDGVHPVPAGNEIVAKTVLEAMGVKR